jgi:transposase
MILSTRKTHVYLCKHPTDMRLGFDGLGVLAKKHFGMSPHNGQYFAFVNARRTRCKILTWDGTGMVLISKRLTKGLLFGRPNPNYKGRLRLGAVEFGQYFEGLNLSGRILESQPDARPRRKDLKWLKKYQKIKPDAKGTRAGTESSIIK